MTSHVCSGDGAQALAQKIEAQPGPPRLLPGGGKRLRFHDGHEVVIGGEALRVALQRRRIQKPYIFGDVINNGAEIVVDASAVQGWLNRGATLLGPMCTIVGEEPLRAVPGPSIADQKDAARESQRHRERPIHFLE